MTTQSVDIFSAPVSHGSLGADFDRVEWARRASKRAKDERIKWQAMARMLARNPKLKLALSGSRSETDGETIWVRVPIELGNPVEHIRLECGKRGPDLIKTCPACAVLEDVSITIFHECSHIINDSFAEISDEDRINLVREAIRIESNGKPNSKRMQALRARIEKGPIRSYWQATSSISPWLQYTLNVLDDVRVNKAMMDARPGTKVMFEAQTNAVFNNGISHPDGTFSKWYDAPPNMQALIGIYCLADDVPLEGKLHPDIIDRLDDEQLRDLVHHAKTSRSIKYLYRLSIQVLERLRELGFCKVPDEPEDEPEPQFENEQQPEPQSGDRDDDSESNEDDPQAGDDSGDNGGDDADADSEESGDGDDADGEDAGSGGSADADDDESSETGDDAGGSGSDDDSEAGHDGTSDDGKVGGSDDPTDPSSEPENDAKESADSGDDATDGEDADGDDQPGSSGESKDQSLEGDNKSEGIDGEESFGDGEDGPERDQQSGNPADGDESDSEGDQPYDDSSESEWDGSNPEVQGTDEYTQDDFERDGTPEDVEAGLNQFSRHDENGEIMSGGEQGRGVVSIQADRDEVDRAIVQGDYFDSPSQNIYGVSVFKPGEGPSWRNDRYIDDFKIDEKILSPALLRLRLIFDDNKRGKHERNLSSGRLDGKNLYKLPTGDDRIFHQRKQPGKKDWFVLIGLDVSGSTSGRALQIIKRAAYAKAELCSRVGVKFAIYAHSADHDYTQGVSLALYEVKAPDAPWDTSAKQALRSLGASSANLDGHTLEYYRKVCQTRPEARKIILYYTDGAMPLANYEEELAILQENIEICRRLQIDLVGVGIKNDDPVQYGLDTVILDEIEDVPKVVAALEKRLRRQE